MAAIVDRTKRKKKVLFVVVVVVVVVVVIFRADSFPFYLPITEAVVGSHGRVKKKKKKRKKKKKQQKKIYRTATVSGMSGIRFDVPFFFGWNFQK